MQRVDSSLLRQTITARGKLNVGKTERIVSAAAGAALAAYGLGRGGQRPAATVLAGGILLYRGLSGHCPVYGGLGRTKSMAAGAIAARNPVATNHSVTISRMPDELYQFWRNLSNLPRFMSHLEMVTEEEGGRQSHWVARTLGGLKLEWDAEIVDEVVNEKIAWRSLEGSDLKSRGVVRFERAPNGRETIVRVSFEYHPPAGRVGAAVARLFGEEPSQQIAEDLRRLKQLMEAGEIPTIEGQPRGARAPRIMTSSHA
jgi:uncharacterized membrane protein